MTLLGSKKGYSKTDINFFEEFSASARKQTQVLAVVVFVGVIAIGITLAILFFDIWRNYNVQKDIDGLNATLASDEYAGLELRSQVLQEEINAKNQYYYALTEMRRIIDKTTAASTDIVHLLGDSIPSDAYVQSYELTGGSLSISGVTFSYYDAANICYLLNQSDVFTNYVTPSITQDDSLGAGSDVATNPVDIYYDFNITGNLTTESIISVGHYYSSETEGVIALSGVSTQSVAPGSSYEFTGVNSYSVNGVNYTLSSVTVNGTQMSAEQFAVVTADDKISGVANGNVVISLFYTVSEEAEEGSV